MEFNKNTQNRILALRKQFPTEISARVNRSEDGGFCAEITTFPGCFTEADTFSELIEMVNDAVKTYFEIPKEYSQYMPTYLPLIEDAQRLNVFPIRKVTEDLKLILPEREGAPR